MTVRLALGGAALLMMVGGVHPKQVMADDWIYTTRPGDTLWSIGEAYLRRPVELTALQNHNQITDPKKIPPGTQIKIPLTMLKRQPDPVVVSFVRGGVWLRHSKSMDAATALSVGSPLRVGDRINTDAGAGATLTFADGSVVFISEQSELELDTISLLRSGGMVDTRLRLQRGQIQSQVRPRDKPGARFEVITPAAVAAARGTQFRVTSIESPASMRSEVPEGKVGVSAQQVERAVSAGFGVITAKGEPPGQPAKLPLAPNLSRIPATLSPGDRAAWEPLAGAVNYRAIIVHAEARNARVFEQYQPEPILVWPDLKPGDYLVKVRATDTAGFEGLDGEQAVAGLARPPLIALTAPVNESPRNMLNTVNGQLTFHWHAVRGANSYRFQVRAEDAQQPVLDAVTSDLHFMAQSALPPGHYAWRVAARNAQGKLGDFGSESHIVILPTPDNL